jgi:hypothetical protein
LILRRGLSASDHYDGTERTQNKRRLQLHDARSR